MTAYRHFETWAFGQKRAAKTLAIAASHGGQAGERVVRRAIGEHADAEFRVLVCADGHIIFPEHYSGDTWERVAKIAALGPYSEEEWERGLDSKPAEEIPPDSTGARIV